MNLKLRNNSENLTLLFPSWLVVSELAMLLPQEPLTGKILPRRTHMFEKHRPPNSQHGSFGLLCRIPGLLEFIFSETVTGALYCRSKSEILNHDIDC